MFFVVNIKNVSNWVFIMFLDVRWFLNLFILWFLKKSVGYCFLFNVVFILFNVVNIDFVFSWLILLKLKLNVIFSIFFELYLVILVNWFELILFIRNMLCFFW